MRLGFLVFFLLVVALTLFIVAFSVFMHGEVACGDFSDFKRMVRTFPKVEGTVTAADSRFVLPVSATGLATPLFGSDASSRRPLGGNRVAICVRIRNEAPNLAEWLAFHMAVILEFELDFRRGPQSEMSDGPFSIVSTNTEARKGALLSFFQDLQD